MKAFITATGTEIGKTFVTCGLLRHLRARGEPGRALKPVLSGFDPQTAATSDSALLLAAQGQDATLEAIAAISPWRFAAPLSPDWAAALEGRVIDYAAVADFCRAALAAPGSVLIEGIGGVMVPLDARHTVLDLITELEIPVVVVAGSYLGTLSHTLTALEVLRARGLTSVVVINESAGAAPDLDRTAASIAEHGSVATVALRRSAPDSGFKEILRTIEIL